MTTFLQQSSTFYSYLPTAIPTNHSSTHRERGHSLMEVASVLNLQILFCYFTGLIQAYLTVFIGKSGLCLQSYMCKLLAKHISWRHLSWLLYADFKKTLGCRNLNHCCVSLGTHSARGRNCSPITNTSHGSC